MTQRIITNNPLVREKLSSTLEVEYHETDFLGILEIIRDYIHQGEELLTHPLSGSVKPNETPYKSVLVRRGEKGSTNFESVKLIEAAEETAQKFIQLRPDYLERMTPRVKEDCQLIDYTLILSALPSAGVNIY